jgi:hypothetical protein
MDAGWSLVIAAVVAGGFGVANIWMTKRGNDEGKSPNGTRTGVLIYKTAGDVALLTEQLRQHVRDDKVTQDALLSEIRALAASDTAS